MPNGLSVMFATPGLACSKMVRQSDFFCEALAATKGISYG
jgi:hypothetical protein